MGARVLLVDDDCDVRHTLAEILVDEGYDVTEAANGLDALREIERETPDVVLLDLMMPVMDGWKMLHILRRTPRHRELQVVVLSAVPPEGAVDHIQKPVSLDKLLLLLDTVRTKATAASTAH